MKTLNYILIAAILVVILLLIAWYLIRKDKYIESNAALIKANNMKELVKGLQDAMNQVLRSRPEELNLNAQQLEKVVLGRTKLRKALKDASLGDDGAKAYVKDYIYDLMQKKIGVNPSNIDEFIPFSNAKKLSKEERFEILLYYYAVKKGYKAHAFNELVHINNLDQQRNGKYYISEEDIKQIYEKEVKELNYDDKLAILCQRAYELAYGNNIIDEYFKKVDGISGGVSGMPEEMVNYFDKGELNTENIIYSYDSIWLMFEGKPMYLPCIGFEKQSELIRVCRNVHRFNIQKPMTQNNPHIEGEMKDGSRIVVARPPFMESWGFSIRHHGDVSQKKIHDIVTDQNCNIAIQIIEFLVKGNMIFLITGDKGSGKTTLLRSILEFARKTARIQIHESIYELWLRKLFPECYITTFRDTTTITGQEAIEIGKKWESEISLLGEIVSYKVASLIIQMGQISNSLVAGTHHASCTRDLINWFRDARLTGENALSSEKIAELEVAECINFDIHMGNNNGKRYIERITEIIPEYNKDPYANNYRTQDILRFNQETNSYEIVGTFSKQQAEKIRKHLLPDELERYTNLFNSFDCERSE